MPKDAENGKVDELEQGGLCNTHLKEMKLLLDESGNCFEAHLCVIQ